MVQRERTGNFFPHMVTIDNRRKCGHVAMDDGTDDAINVNDYLNMPLLG